MSKRLKFKQGCAIDSKVRQKRLLSGEGDLESLLYNSIKLQKDYLHIFVDQHGNFIQ